MRPRGIKKLKDVIDKALLIRLSDEIQRAYPNFESTSFIKGASLNIENKSFFERIIQAANTLNSFLPSDFEESCSILLKAAPPSLITEGYGVENYHVLILCRYISLYGLEYPQISLFTLGELTQSYTAEFDIRPFIERYPEMSFSFLLGLAKSENFHKRRLASEGCRPRLPLSNHIKTLKEDPNPCIEILTLLRKDPIKYVQKSVSNHIGDILKDNPEIAHRLLSQWSVDNNPITNWIIKRALKRPLGDKNQFADEFFKYL